MRSIFFITLLSFSNILYAVEDFSFNAGLRLQFSRWSGTSNAGEYRQAAPRIGTNLSVQSGKFFAGVNLIRSEYKFTDRAPDRPTGTNPSLPTTIYRNDVDLVFGYQINPRITPTFAIKSVINEWMVDGYRLEASGIGFGLAGNKPIQKPLVLFGHISLFLGPAHIDDVKSGNAGGLSTEFGLSYQLNNTSLSASILAQTLKYEFDNGDILDFAVGGLSLGVQHRF